MRVEMKTLSSRLCFFQTSLIHQDHAQINEENIKLIIDKGLGVTSKGLGALPRKYIPFQYKIFGIWYDYKRFYIGNESNEENIKLIIDKG